MIKCEICKRELDNFKSLSIHIHTHLDESREYYDRFIKKGGEGICSGIGCNCKTKFYNINLGYYKYCSCKCSRSITILNPRSEKQNEAAISLGTVYGKIYGKINGMKNKGREGSEEQKDVARKTMIFYNKSEKHKQISSCRMKNGGAAYANSFIKSPSKPQVNLFNETKKFYPDATLNYPCLNYSIDVAIPSLKIAIEYDGSYWHKDTEKDRIRQEKLEAMGWKFLRYRDYIPDTARLQEDIRRV